MSEKPRHPEKVNNQLIQSRKPDWIRSKIVTLKYFFKPKKL